MTIRTRTIRTGTLRTRTRNRRFQFKATSLLFSIAVLSTCATAQSKSSDYACPKEVSAQMCTAANTCGSASTPCAVDVKRTANAASVTPSIPNAKGESLFCIKPGTTVQWKSTGKDIGFVVDFGPTSPFDPPKAIIGGTDRTVSVVAKRPGCYKYSAGACRSGAIYGMCGQTNVQLIVTPN
jgi:plastocyanin